MLTTQDITAPVFHVGDHVTYLGHPATVVHGFDPADPWLPSPDQRREPSVGIRFDRAVPGMSRQMTVAASSLLPSFGGGVDFTAGWGYAQERADYCG